MSSTSPFLTKPEKRSPFPDPSLPQAGESSRDALLSFFFFQNRLMLLALYALFAAVLAMLEWYRYWLRLPPMPKTYTVIALILITWLVLRFLKLKPQIERLALGVRGERIVGRMLDDLRRDDYRVYHDIPDTGDSGAFNVDHLLIGPAGVFVLETKTQTKPGGRTANVTYDGQRVLVDGYTPDRDPIKQAKALSDYIRDQLHKQTGSRVDVRGVVVYPKWWVESPGAGARTWVLNPDQLGAILRREPRRLSPNDIALFANAVEVAVRQGVT